MLLILSVSLVLSLVAVDGEVGCSLSYFSSIYVGAGTEGVLVGDQLMQLTYGADLPVSSRRPDSPIPPSSLGESGLKFTQCSSIRMF